MVVVERVVFKVCSFVRTAKIALISLTNGPRTGTSKTSVSTHQIPLAEKCCSRTTRI